MLARPNFLFNTTLSSDIFATATGRNLSLNLTQISGNALNKWLHFKSFHGGLSLSGIPNNTDLGISSNLLLVATDNVSTVSTGFAITVVINHEPKIINPPPNIAQGFDATLFFGIPDTTAKDDDGDPLFYRVTQKPAWLNYNESTRVFSAKPTRSNIGKHLIQLTISDGDSEKDLSFTINLSGTTWLFLIMSLASSLASTLASIYTYSKQKYRWWNYKHQAEYKDNKMLIVTQGHEELYQGDKLKRLIDRKEDPGAKSKKAAQKKLPKKQAKYQQEDKIMHVHIYLEQPGFILPISELATDQRGTMYLFANNQLTIKGGQAGSFFFQATREDGRALLEFPFNVIENTEMVPLPSKEEPISDEPTNNVDDLPALKKSHDDDSQNNLPAEEAVNDTLAPLPPLTSLNMGNTLFFDQKINEDNDEVSRVSNRWSDTSVPDLGVI